jgi:hypothetical protein
MDIYTSAREYVSTLPTTQFWPEFQAIFNRIAVHRPKHWLLNLFAQIVDHPARRRFMELYANISLPDALGEAQEILIHCGAVSYCIDQLLRRHQTIQKILKNTQFANPQPPERFGK